MLEKTEALWENVAQYQVPIRPCTPADTTDYTTPPLPGISTRVIRKERTVGNLGSSRRGADDFPPDPKTRYGQEP